MIVDNKFPDVTMNISRDRFIISTYIELSKGKIKHLQKNITYHKSINYQVLMEFVDNFMVYVTKEKEKNKFKTVE